MAVEFLNINNLSNISGLSGQKILQSTSGEILATTNNIITTNNITLKQLQFLLSQPMIHPMYRVSVLNSDETINYIIPESDIINNGISYNEGYQNGDRRSISLKLVNITKQEFSKTQKKIIETKPYIPTTTGLWYGTKIGYDVGLLYKGQEYLLSRGVYIISSFDLSHSTNAREVVYELKDKFSQFSGTTGVVNAGYEIPVGTPVAQCVNDILNISCSDGSVYDIKSCVIDSSYTNFVTQSTIRIDEGGHISELIDQLATQMGAEYFYNNVGILVFYPIDDSMNDVNKPILWSYDEFELNGLEIKGAEDVVNVIKITGTNVDGHISSAVVKNENLASPINIYRVKERREAPEDNANVWTDEMAQQLGEYRLRNKTLYQLSQTISVPFNPLLSVNNMIELNNEDLNMDRTRWLIKSISYTTGDESMSLEIASLDYLPFMSKGVR